MSPLQVGRLHEQREKFVALLAAIRARETGAQPLSFDEVREIGEVEHLLKLTDQQLRAADRAAEPPDPAQAPISADGCTFVAGIPKGKRAGLRVMLKPWKGRQIVDLRLWFLPDGGNTWTASRKGVAIDSSKLQAVIEALKDASNHMTRGADE